MSRIIEIDLPCRKVYIYCNDHQYGHHKNYYTFNIVYVYFFGGGGGAVKLEQEFL